MLEQMEKYVQSVVPDGMPQRKREPLHDELLCHLLDRYEFYREIGFDDEEAHKKRFMTWAKTKRQRTISETSLTSCILKKHGGRF